MKSQETIPTSHLYYICLFPSRAGAGLSMYTHIHATLSSPVRARIYIIEDGDENDEDRGAILFSYAICAILVFSNKTKTNKLTYLRKKRYRERHIQ